MDLNYQNEYEIINSNGSSYPSNRNNDYSRYPYTNNPNQPLQHTSYKDWINGCQTNQIYDENPEIFASADTIAALSAGIIVVGTLLGATGGGAVVGGILISIGTLLPIYWKPSSDPNNIIT
ncbi:hypothetical protein [Bacillus thuringiensis]|uniref:hypothetical protein n=1 Tax=Bacillus thuringiensis TaxID=1428 RepID=UPI000A36A8C2|nr:hypothetical protein [Bacillus thuringiensis]OUA82762.1 hypothetical protein BK706_31195 [Bacillus thuringiensis serovar leesis]OUA92390.1 hypothetical protein BK706_10405 [Bacillus thuringiensis serovar leesis]OUA92402.1 hypothetical protein BK706_10345 [Bacillus thuringiensis serovar leesis]